MFSFNFLSLLFSTHDFFLLWRSVSPVPRSTCSLETDLGFASISPNSLYYNPYFKVLPLLLYQKQQNLFSLQIHCQLPIIVTLMYLNTITAYVDQNFEIWLPKCFTGSVIWHYLACILSSLPFSDVFSSQAMYFCWLMSNILTTTSLWWLPNICFHFRPSSWTPNPYFIWILVTFM